MAVFLAPVSPESTACIAWNKVLSNSDPKFLVGTATNIKEAFGLKVPKDVNARIMWEDFEFVIPFEVDYTFQ